MTEAELQYTPFDRALRALGGEFLEFAGWAWSTTFGDPFNEHLAVRERVGMWDQSALPKWRVHGSDAIEALDFVFTNDIRRLRPGQVRYSPFCDENGRMISDATIYKFADDSFWVFPTLESDLDYVRDLTSQLDVSIESFTAEFGLLDIQGPQSREVLNEICDRSLDSLRYFHFWPTEVSLAGVPCYLSRTGYSGELGYEVLCRPEDGDRLYQRLLATERLTPYGLTAVETIRIESGLLFIGIDYTPFETSPLDLSLDRFIALDKARFNGKEPLAQAIEHPQRRLCTLELDTDDLPAYGSRVSRKGINVGRMTSVCTSPSYARVLGLAILETELAQPGTTVEVESGSTVARGTVTQHPFHDTDRKRPRS